MNVAVMLVEDHVLVRQGLRTMLEKENGVDVVGEAADGREAIRKVEELQPDVVLMDLAMEGMCGQEATRRIKQANPDVRIVAVSVYEHKDAVLRMFEAGADGYVPKASAFQEIRDALRAVTDGKAYLSPAVAGPLLRNRVEKGSGFQGETELTPREREILQLVAEGHTSKEIARTLDVSPKTVDNHRQNIMSKLDLHSVSELTKYAIKQGLTGL